MTDWREATLGEGLKVRHGYAFKGEYFAETGDFIVLTPGNFIDTGGFKSKSGAEKYYDGPVPPGYLLHGGDVIVAMTEQAHGLLGSSATIPADGRYLHNQRLGLLEVTDARLLDLRFVYHLMNSPAVRSQIQATATGSKVRHTAPERIEAVKVRVPPPGIQRAIAAVLDTLGDLIENNRRRIELLAEMARASYREWFVHFRYPGHETAVFVDTTLGTIPEDWAVGRVDAHFVLQRGFDLPTKDREPGTIPVIGASGPQGFHSMPKVVGPGLTTGRSGTIGVVTYVSSDFWPLNTALWVKEFRLATPRSAYFLLSALDLVQAASGAAVPTLNRNVVHSLSVPCPPRQTIERWDSAVAPMFDLRETVRRQSERLVVIRDFLLPKLVVGEIDVSSFDLGALVEDSVV